MPKKILIADDELHLVHIISYKLKQAGYTLFTAHNGRDGYTLACQQLPDLIVTDFQMPVLDGFEMAVKLRNNPDTAQIPLIMLTARGHKIPPSDLAKTNIQAMMAKPFSAMQLVDHVAELLAARCEQPNDPANHRSGEGHAA